MSTQSLILVPVVGCLLLGCNRSPPVPPAVVPKAVEAAGDNRGSALLAAGDNYWHCMGGVSLIEGDNCAFFPGAILFGKDQRPLVCFGLIKRPKDKSKFLYILLFKSPKNAGWQSREIGTQSQGPTSVQDDTLDGTRVIGKIHLVLDDKRIETAYEAEIDRKTNALITEALTIGGQDIAPGEPRVFLVDLTQDTVSYRPVNVDLPDEAPEATSGHQSWGVPVMRAVEELREKSAEVKSFLEEKPKR